MKKKKVDIKLLKETFDYNENEGLLIWKFRERYHFKSYNQMHKHNLKSGTIVNQKNKDGYITVYLNSKTYPAHVIIYALWYNRWPDEIIDHINHIRDDNRIINLREVSRKENSRNRTLNKNNKHGITGITYDEKRELWVSSIVDNNGKHKYLGSFQFKQSAISSRKEAEKLYNYHENHGK